MTLQEFTDFAAKYNSLERKLKSIPKENFIETICKVLNTDEAYAKNVYYDFQTYPIAWLLNRQPMTQSEALLNLI